MEPTTEMVTTDTTDATTEDYFTEYPVDYCPEGYHVNEFGESEGKKNNFILSRLSTLVFPSNCIMIPSVNDKKIIIHEEKKHQNHTESVRVRSDLYAFL